MSKIIIYICFFFILANCSNNTSYSGKVLNQDDLENVNFTNKEKLISRLGNPSYIDPFEKKFFYFFEKSEKKSILKKKINYSFVFVFEIDDNDQVINKRVYDIKNIENIKFAKDQTSNEIVRRGLIERIFGGVGAQQELPTTP